uniref:Uncharacterized protein n=1 Tax=Arundo donax TaxID=35708 RepID=A0A0A9AKC0_ARUDO
MLRCILMRKSVGLISAIWIPGHSYGLRILLNN